jgi:hypothetical protein
MATELDDTRTTLDDFGSWDDVHAQGSNWRRALLKVSDEEGDQAIERLNESLVKEFLDQAIPPKDRFADLKTLEPSTQSQMPVALQTEILETMRKQDFACCRANGRVHGWAFFGSAGWSKSTLCTAWFAQYARVNVIDIDQMRSNRGLREVIDFPRGRFAECMWRMNALNLIDENLSWQHRDFADKSAKHPRVSSAWVEALASMSIYPCLYLEEVDKVRTDKTKLDILFDAINSLYNYNGVLLLNSNLTKQEFASQFGPEFARRIGEMCNVVDCFAQEIKLCPAPAKEAR